jgi:hypothetical protein
MMYASGPLAGLGGPVTERDQIAATVQAIAAILWAGFDKNERTGVRFGMFPFGKMTAAEKELQAEFPSARRDSARLLSVALMECARCDGGMRA